jgi:predicted transcriptional regulator
MDALLALYRDYPQAGPSDAGRSIGVSRQTVYTYLAELEGDGRIVRDGGRIRIVQ